MIPRGLKRTEGNPGIILTHIKIQCYSWLKNWTNDSIQEINRWPQHLFFSVQTKISLFLLWPQQTLRICLLRQVCTAVGIWKKEFRSSALQQAAACLHMAISNTSDSTARPVRDQSQRLRIENAAWGSAGMRRGLQVRSLPSWDGGGGGGDGKGGLGGKRGSCKQLQKPGKYVSIQGADSSWAVTTKYNKAIL